MHKVEIIDLGENVFVPIPDEVLQKHGVKEGESLICEIFEREILIRFQNTK